MSAEPGHSAEDYKRIYLNALPAWKRWLRVKVGVKLRDHRAEQVVLAHFSSPFEQLDIPELLKEKIKEL